MKIEYLPHTADIRMRIQGNGLEDLFRAGVLGMGNILKEGICDQEHIFDRKAEIEIVAADPTCLLIDFLSEVLSHSYTEKSVFCKVKFLGLSSVKGVAEIYGKKVDGFDEEIKAVTYHEAEVHNSGIGGLQTMVVFDI
ncbi:archease [Flavobacteriaceae bacterium TP-CH-4]|uniref:Archease n=1 Tax=Pelagihabitans pacificus TaxID=2696054 RepID=A0A967E6L2_9FLAO|nr:archease [Pelagihabitans pacificus]NHF59730.1 archease [Pelagihabitans pacificus]